MPYDDDDDLFGDEFDFVDDDDSVVEDSELEEKPPAKPTKKKAAAKGKEKPEKSDKPAARAPKRGRNGGKAAEKPAAKREPRRDDREGGEGKASKPGPSKGSKEPLEKAPVGYLSFAHGLDVDDEEEDAPTVDRSSAPEEVAAATAPADEPAVEVEPPVPAGPPADHVVHIYEHGVLKRTIPRKFTDEQAVGFAEEFTRTNKAYGRYAVATPEDEEPAPTFAKASK
jgi:hypothetical protein